MVQQWERVVVQQKQGLDERSMMRSCNSRGPMKGVCDVVQEKQGPYKRSMMRGATAGEGGGAREAGAI